MMAFWIFAFVFCAVYAASLILLTRDPMYASIRKMNRNAAKKLQKKK